MRRVLLMGLIAGAAIGGLLWARAMTPATSAAPVLRFDGGGDVSGFARATVPREFRFPQDHGPHIDFQTEWWYYTGNLVAEGGGHVGYQLTFFRRGLSPGRLTGRDSGFATNQVYFAHFAITDVGANRHREAERFSRGAAGLAGATGEPFGVWLEDWKAEAMNPDGSAVRLVAREGDMSLDLTVRAEKSIVAHGDGGLSPKSEAPGNASYYLSYTRMATQGRVTLNGETSEVSGVSWFDHEWSTSALGPNAVGWDWFSLQLSDGRELMFFRIRQQDGSIEPVSGGTLVEPDGRTIRLAGSDVQIEERSRWHSQASGGDYPARWRISVPSADMELTVEPWIADQEMRVSFVYWEGAVRLAGASRGESVTGNGYVEMTGYVRSMQGEF